MCLSVHHNVQILLMIRSTSFIPISAFQNGAGHSYRCSRCRYMAIPKSPHFHPQWCPNRPMRSVIAVIVSSSRNAAKCVPTSICLAHVCWTHFARRRGMASTPKYTASHPLPISNRCEFALNDDGWSLLDIVRRRCPWYGLSVLVGTEMTRWNGISTRDDPIHSIWTGCHVQPTTTWWTPKNLQLTPRFLKIFERGWCSNITLLPRP